MKKDVSLTRDPSKVKWKRDWAKYKALSEENGKNPHGLVALWKERRSSKLHAQKVNPSIEGAEGAGGEGQ